MRLSSVLSVFLLMAAAATAQNHPQVRSLPHAGRLGIDFDNSAVIANSESTTLQLQAGNAAVLDSFHLPRPQGTVELAAGFGKWSYIPNSQTIVVQTWHKTRGLTPPFASVITELKAEAGHLKGRTWVYVYANSEDMLAGKGVTFSVDVPSFYEGWPAKW